MKQLKTKKTIKDKMAGFLYTAVASNKTHWLAVDSFGHQVMIHKTQAYIVGGL